MLGEGKDSDFGVWSCDLAPFLAARAAAQGLGSGPPDLTPGLPAPRQFFGADTNSHMGSGPRDQNPAFVHFRRLAKVWRNLATLGATTKAQ